MILLFPRIFDCDNGFSVKRSSNFEFLTNCASMAEAAYTPSRWEHSDPDLRVEQADTVSATLTEASLVEPSFDENILRTLCDLDVSVDGFPCSFAWSNFSLGVCSAVYRYYLTGSSRASSHAGCVHLSICVVQYSERLAN